MSIVLIVLGILVVTYVSYYIAYNVSKYILSNPIKPVNKQEQFDLSVVSQVASSEELKKSWTNVEGSTLLFFVFPEIKDRTSVSGNEYTNVINIGAKQSFKLLVTPDAGRGYGMAPAILEVYVKGSSTPEQIEVPNVPLQRWTSIVIVKDGRKFNIYINGFLRASKLCTAMPDFDVSQPLRTGDLRLGGKIALVSLAPYPMNANDVRLLISNSAGTDGAPYLSSGSSFPIPNMNTIFKLLSCPGGNCVTPKQAGPMEEWSSPYE